MKKLLTLLLLALTVSAFAINVTFKVSMKGSGVDYDSVFVVGEPTAWAFVQMVDEGDSRYSASINLTAGDSLAYYFITIGYWATDYLAYRETVPEECALSAELTGDPGWTTDRAFIVPNAPLTISYYWGTCTEVSAGVGINERNEIDPEFELYPNPTNGLVTLNLSEITNRTNIEILDISGKTVKNIETSAKTTSFDVSDLSNGLYMVRVLGGTTTLVRKLIVQ
jgi:hypothetical protein